MLILSQFWCKTIDFQQRGLKFFIIILYQVEIKFWLLLFELRPGLVAWWLPQTVAILEYLDIPTYFMSGQTNNKQRSSYIALGATRQYTSHSDSLVREMVQL